MCKNLAVVGFKPSKDNNKLWDFAMAATPFMTANDKDGVGYVAFGDKGLWGERWLNPEEAWRYRKVFSEKDRLLKKSFEGTLLGNTKYNKFGIANPAGSKAMLLHSRMATCEKSISNTHPFVNGKTALIHNGVISNHDAKEFEKVTSTCDSEIILNSYVKHNVTEFPANIKDALENVRGNYACGVLTTDSQGKEYLDVFRGGYPQLHATWVIELDALVFCTSEEIIIKTLEALKWNHNSFFKIKEEVMIRIDASTGLMVSKHDFKHGGYGNYNYYGRNHWEKKDDYTGPVEKKTSLSIVPVTKEASAMRNGTGSGETTTTEQNTNRQLNSDDYNYLAAYGYDA